jgi:hypothetical protein
MSIRSILSVAATLATTFGALGGVVALSQNLTVEREQIASVAWVQPYQTACLQYKTVKVSAWDVTVNPSMHRKVNIDGSDFRFHGKFRDDDDTVCGGEGVLLDLYRS